MKHLYILLLFLFFAFFPSARSVKAENMMIDIEVNGTKIYTDSAPFIKNGNVFIALIYILLSIILGIFAVAFAQYIIK